MALKKSGFVVSREAIVINVGGRPERYGKVAVTDRRTGQRVEILDTDNEPVDPGDLGTPYAFKAYQKVPRSHPAFEANPGAFMEPEDAEELVAL